MYRWKALKWRRQKPKKGRKEWKNRDLMVFKDRGFSNKYKEEKNKMWIENFNHKKRTTKKITNYYNSSNTE
jgi:hypothetical protein